MARGAGGFGGSGGTLDSDVIVVGARGMSGELVALKLMESAPNAAANERNDE